MSFRRSFCFYVAVLLFLLTPAAQAEPFLKIELNEDLTFDLEVPDGGRLHALQAGFLRAGTVIPATRYEQLAVRTLEQGRRIELCWTSSTLPTMGIAFDVAANETTFSSWVEAGDTGINGLVPFLTERGTSKSMPDLFEAAERVYLNGYQSWAFSGWVALDREKARFDDPLRYQAWGNNNRHLSLDSHLSWWMFGVAGVGGKNPLFFGALSAQRWKTSFVSVYTKGSLRRLAVLNGSHGEPLQFGRVTSERLHLAWNSAATIDRYAQRLRPALALGETASYSGWNSWNSVATNVDEALVLANTRTLAGPLAGLGLKAVYIDDGWSKSWGDWLPNGKFPSGMDGLAASISAAGFTPGLWIAPFVVDRSSDVARQHPEWLLKDGKGNPIPYDMAPQLAALPASRYLLDVTVPEVRVFVTETFRRLWSWGYRIFKVDFLIGAAYEGVRSRPVTAIEAYREGLAAIREGLPEEAKIIACGAPLVPTVGWSQAMRIGPDIHHPSLPLLWSYLANAGRSTANLAPFHQRVFQNDPDTVLIRKPLSEDQARASLAFLALSGGIFVLGDDLTVLDEARLALLTESWVEKVRSYPGRLVALDRNHQVGKKVYNTFFQPILDRGRYSGVQPELWLRGDGDQRLLGVFNWGPRQRALTVPLDNLVEGCSATEILPVTGEGCVVEQNALVCHQRPSSAFLCELRCKKSSR